MGATLTARPVPIVLVNTPRCDPDHPASRETGCGAPPSDGRGAASSVSPPAASLTEQLAAEGGWDVDVDEHSPATPSKVEETAPPAPLAVSSLGVSPPDGVPSSSPPSRTRPGSSTGGAARIRHLENESRQAIHSGEAWAPTPDELVDVKVVHLSIVRAEGLAKNDSFCRVYWNKVKIGKTQTVKGAS